MGRGGEVHGGDADGVADAPAMADHLSQHMGVAQELPGPLHLAQLHQTADVGGADGDAAHLHLGNDIAAQPQLPALAL